MGKAEKVHAMNAAKRAIMHGIARKRERAKEATRVANMARAKAIKEEAEVTGRAPTHWRITTTMDTTNRSDHPSQRHAAA